MTQADREISMYEHVLEYYAGLKEAERKDREKAREELVKAGLLPPYMSNDFGIKKPTEAEQKWLGERTYSLAGKKPEIKFTYGLSWELSGEAGLKMKAAADKLWDELAAILAEDTSKGPVKKEMSYGEKVAATKAEMDEILARLRSREGWIEHLEAKIAFYRDYLAKIDIRLEDIEAKVNGVQPKVSAGGWVTGIDPAYKINLQAEYVWDQLRQATLGCNSVAQMFDAIRTKMAQITKYSDDTYFKPAFKEGDPVLVRNNSSCHWVGKRFHAKSDIKGSGYPYQASDGSKWTHCIEFDIDKMGTI